MRRGCSTGQTDMHLAWEGRDKDAERGRISTILLPLISSVYTIKAITCCLCQRVRNNTLVTEGERRGKGEGGARITGLEDEPLHQLERRLVAAVTNTGGLWTTSSFAFTHLTAV